MSFLEIKNLKVHYPIRGGFFNKIIDYVYAVDGVDTVSYTHLTLPTKA